MKISKSPIFPLRVRKKLYALYVKHRIKMHFKSFEDFLLMNVHAINNRKIKSKKQ